MFAVSVSINESVGCFILDLFDYIFHRRNKFVLPCLWDIAGEAFGKYERSKEAGAIASNRQKWISRATVHCNRVTSL